MPPNIQNRPSQFMVERWRSTFHFTIYISHTSKTPYLTSGSMNLLGACNTLKKQQQRMKATESPHLTPNPPVCRQKHSWNSVHSGVCLVHGRVESTGSPRKKNCKLLNNSSSLIYRGHTSIVWEWKLNPHLLFPMLLHFLFTSTSE